VPVANEWLQEHRQQTEAAPEQLRQNAVKIAMVGIAEFI